MNINDLLKLFSQTFQISFDLNKYEILFFNKPINSMTKFDFTQLDNYQRFKIQLNNNQIIKQVDPEINDEDEIVK